MARRFRLENYLISGMDRDRQIFPAVDLQSPYVRELLSWRLCDDRLPN